MERSPHFALARIRRVLLAALVAGLLSGPALAATITVNVANDENVDNGNCSLREAIVAANTNAAYNGCTAGSGADTIAFDLPAGFQNISIGSALPNITSEIHIDGYSKSDATPNTLASGTDAVINVGIYNGGGVVYGLTLVPGASGSSIRGLRIAGFATAGIYLFGDSGLSNVTIAGNFIGTDGNADLGNATAGVLFYSTISPGATNSLIGGPLPADRNLISGNDTAGINISGPGSSGITIQNNLIGTTADGVSLIAQHYGIWLSRSGNNTITGNVIGGNNGVFLSGQFTDDNLVTANAIGVGADGVSDIGGTGSGVLIFATFSGGGGPQDNVIGGVGANDGNVIANWGQDGVHINRDDALLASFSTGNQILGNRIYANGVLGIELADQATASGAGVSANDANDVDTGPNGYQNFPVITAAVTNGANTAVSFTLDGEPSNTQYRLEFFSNASCDVSGHGEGEVFLYGQTWVASDGDLAETAMSLPATTPGHFITMTATTYDIGTKETSEFSACQAVTFGALNGEPPVATPVMSLPVLAMTALLLMLGGGLARRRRS
jgi:CSLREA domain-containing protein